MGLRPAPDPAPGDPGGLIWGTSLSAPLGIPLPGGLAVVYTCAAPDKPAEANEDAAAVLVAEGGVAVLAVADGAGGMSGGAAAARLTMQALQARLRDHGGAGTLREPILAAVESARDRILALGQGAGATFAAAELSDGHMRPYHVGDAMILVTGQRGRVKLQTVSHSPVGYAYEAGLIDEEEAMLHEERHLVSNFVGSADMHVQVGSETDLAPRDTLVIASDGLFDNLYVEELTELVRTGPLERCAVRLAEACRRRMLGQDPDHPGKPDDLSFILYRRRPAGRVRTARRAARGGRPGR